MFFSLQQILALLTLYKYAIIFPLAVLEGPVVAVVSGFLASVGALNVFIVFLVLLLGDFVGDTIYYVFGRWGGRNFLVRWGRYIGVTEEGVSKLEKHFTRHSGKILLFGKMQMSVLPTGVALLFFAGLSKMSYGKFIFYNILGSLPRIFLLEVVGFYSAKSLSIISKIFFDEASAVSLIMLFVAIFAIAFLMLQKNKNSKE